MNFTPHLVAAQGSTHILYGLLSSAREGDVNVCAISRVLDDTVEGRSLGAAARAVPKNSHSGETGFRSAAPCCAECRMPKKSQRRFPKTSLLRVSGKWCTDKMYFLTDKDGRYMAGVMDV